VFNQPAPVRKIEPFNLLAQFPGSIFLDTLEAEVIAIQIDDRPEQIVGVRNHRDFEVIGQMPLGDFRFRTIVHFFPKPGSWQSVQSQKSSSRAQEVSRHLRHL
jgi:hypothetical protein